MDLSAAHLGFVVGAYAASLAVLACLVLWIALRDRRARRELREAEARREKEP